MKETLSKFYEMLNSSADMQKKINDLEKAFAAKHDVPSPDDGADALYSFRKQAVEEIVIPVAKEAGYELTSDDILTYAEDSSGLELSEDELKAVAGGTTGGDYDTGGLFACAGIGIGFGTTSVNNDKCFIVGLGFGACSSSGDTQ